MIGTKCHEELARILKDERKKRGIRQVALAKQLREQQNWITRLERGQRTVRVCEFLVLAKLIGFNPISILRKLIKAVEVPGKTAAATKRPAPRISRR